MSDKHMSYNLVHIVTGGEHKTPLVASQVFDRAEAQMTVNGSLKPQTVSVFIIVPMRELFIKKEREIISRLKLRCPSIKINVIGGINRLNNWPLSHTLLRLRKKLKHKTVYHCRGEAAFVPANILKKKFPQDVIVLDIRGYGPLERFASKNIFDLAGIPAHEKKIYDQDVATLRRTINNSDWVCTVSEPLRQYLIKNAGAKEDTVVVPCCVQKVLPGGHRNKIREELNINDKIAILYLGGTQKYQHLEDLVLPFIESALSSSDKYIAVLITQNKDKMADILSSFQIDMNRTRILTLPQHIVGNYLTAMDIGLLLRAPSELNNFSQPVKFGEYLSAGIPIVLEEGTGNLSGILADNKIGCTIKLTGKSNKKDFDNEVFKALEWYSMNCSTVVSATRKFVTAYYTWEANVPIERNMYYKAFQNAEKQ